MNLEQMKKLGTKVQVGDKVVPVTTFTKILKREGLSLGKDYRLCYALSLKEAVDLCREERGNVDLDRVRELRFKRVWVSAHPETKGKILDIFSKREV